jgi:1-pyrroline-5-carboxylate dehydrogenase
LILRVLRTRNAARGGRTPIIKLAGEGQSLLIYSARRRRDYSAWNFPLAIMAGMTRAAVVTGKHDRFTPSPDAPTIAYKFMKF